MRYISLTLIFLSLLSVLDCQVSAATYNATTLPNPKNNGQDYYVCNPDNILSYSAVSQLNQLAKDLDKETEVELCTIVIENFDERTYADANDFGVKVFNTWGIGKKSKNTGVLVLLVIDSRDIQIITGGGVEGLLPDITCGNIIDNHIQYLSSGNYDSGLIAISQDITDYLTTDLAKAELLLGWTPKTHNPISEWYFTCGFILLIFFSIGGYNSLKGEQGQRKAEILQKSDTSINLVKAFSFIFPLPIALFYFLFKRLRLKIKDVPVICNHCHQQMELISDGMRVLHLTNNQLAEEQVGAMEYDVWQCQTCKRTDNIAHSGLHAGKFILCPICGARTYSLNSSLILSKATYSRSGERQDTFHCEHCGHTDIKIVALPVIQRPVVISSGGNRGGSFGGGIGGGSFGGGMTFGGGAGRKF